MAYLSVDSNATPSLIIRRIILSFVLAALIGCASKPSVDFHKLALLDTLPSAEREALLLPFEAIIVGVEKDNQSRIGAIRECTVITAYTECIHIDSPYFTSQPALRENLRAKYRNQYRPTFVSHVVSFDKETPPCALFTIYSGIAPCNGLALKLQPASVAASWQALRTLQDSLDLSMGNKPPTHVVVYTMGWNRIQAEAIGNVRDLVQQLLAASVADGSNKDAFRPLVLAVTWPSTGSPTISSADFGIKAKDADEVGAVWINALIHRTLQPLKQRHGFRLVVVGHSFGARATSRATFSAPLLRPEENGPPVVDLLLGLQGAYSFQRYGSAENAGDPDGNEGAPYRDFAKGAGTVALTASSFDTAVTAFLHGPYFVGSHQAYMRSRNSPHAERFQHVRAGADGLVEGVICGPERVLYIDASDAIREPHPGTGGGAHSGIYTPQIGRMTYQLIRSCAP